MKRAKSKKAKDFPKKRRKVGKGRIPENATTVSFTTKAVVVPTQLEETREPTTKRKLSLQTLLNQLSHHKPSVRHDALSGLREFFQEHLALLAPNIGRLVQHVFILLVDPEASVRHALCTFLKFFFASVVEEHIQSFFSIVVAHLSCGLTHINERIQLDALNVFNLLLSHHPKLLIPHAEKLLPLLVGLVSRQESVFGSRREAKLESIAALASNPASKLSHHTSRVEIFAHLGRFLQVLLDGFEETSGQLSRSSSSSAQASLIDVANRTVLVKQDKSGRLEPIHSALCDFSHRVPHVAVVQSYGVQIPENAFLCSPCVVGGGSFHSSQPTAAIFTDNAKLLEFSQLLISLLLECWIECSPSSLLGPSLRDSSSLALMEMILNLLSLLLKLVLRVDRDQPVEPSLQDASEPSITEALCKRFCADFQKHFMVYFPFFGASTSVRKPQKYSMNLAVCQIMLLLLSSDPPKNLQLSTISKTLFSVCDFYASFQHHAKTIVDSTQILTSSIASITEALPLLLGVLSAHRCADEILPEAVKGIWSLYEACHPQSAAKRLLIQCFSSLYEGVGKQIRDDIRSVLRSNLLLPWLQSLPDLFVKIEASNPETSARIIVAMAAAAVAGDRAHLQGLQKNMGHLLGPSSVLPTLPPFIQRRVCEVVWWLPDLGLAELSLLARSICSGKLRANIMTYLVQTVHHRLTHTADLKPVDQPTCVQRYLSFMLTVATGYTEEELRMIAADSTPLVPGSHTPILLSNPSAHVSADYRAKLQETACECVLAAPFADDALLLMQPAIKSLLEKFHTLPVDAAAGILKLGSHLSPKRGFPDQLVASYGKLCFSCLVSMEMPHPLSSLDHHVVSICAELTNQILSRSHSITQATVHEFQNLLVGQVSSQQRAMTETFIRLLSSASINATLRQCREDICSTATSIVDNLQPENEDLKQQLELSVAKFRPLEDHAVRL